MAWVGIAEFKDALERIVAQGDAAAKEIVERAAAIAEAETKANFDGAHKKGKPHTGGDKPNVVTGSLRRSITADPIVSAGPLTYSTKVGPRMVYGRRVELGYKGSKGYPYFSPGVESAGPKMQAAAEETWRKFLSA